MFWQKIQVVCLGISDLAENSIESISSGVNELSMIAENVSKAGIKNNDSITDIEEQIKQFKISNIQIDAKELVILK